MKTIEVVAAVIQKENKILATRRNYGEFKGGWEFPGGKIEANETHKKALAREIQEELNIHINIFQFLTTTEYTYPNFHLIMHCYLCKFPKDEILSLTVHDQFKWVGKEELSSINWLPADIPVAKKMMQQLE